MTALWSVYNVCDTLGSAATVCLLIALGGGWTVVRRKLFMKARIRMTFFVTAYFMLRVAAIFWAAFVDGGTSSRVNYEDYYVSPPAVMVIVLEVFTTARFIMVNRKIAERHQVFSNRPHSHTGFPISRYALPSSIVSAPTSHLSPLSRLHVSRAAPLVHRT